MKTLIMRTLVLLLAMSSIAFGQLPAAGVSANTSGANRTLSNLTNSTFGSGQIGIFSSPTKLISTLSFGLDATAAAYTGIAGVTVAGAGNGSYTSTCTVGAPQISGGTQATCTALLSGGNVTSIQITVYGSGYSSVPTITVAGGTGQTFTAVLTDECGNIANALLDARNKNIAKVFADGFTGTQVCQYDPFKNTNTPFELVFGSARLMASTNMWPPRLPHYVHGLGGAATNTSLGTILEECGPDSGTGSISFASSTCTVTTPNGVVKIPQFPCEANCAGNSNTTQLTFTTPFHAIFPAGTYTCFYCDGGGSVGTNGNGWNNDAFGLRLEHLKLDGGGNVSTFLYYNENAQERSELDDVNYGHIGGASTTVNSAAFFWDRTEAPTNQSGPTHFEIRNVNGNTNSSASSVPTGAWGAVFQGSNAYCQLSGGGGSGATCFVQKISGGTPFVVVGYPGSGYSSAPAWKVWGAPATFGGTPIQDCTGVTSIASNAVVGMDNASNRSASCNGANGNSTATDYGNGFIAAGPEGMKGTFQGQGSCGTTGCLSGGVLITGAGNASVDYLHCEQMSGNACLQIGDGSSAVIGGHFKTIDGTSTVATNLVHILPGADGQQNFFALQFTSVTGTPNIMNDESTISGNTGSQRIITTAQVVGFGSTRSIEYYSAGLGLLNSQPDIFVDNLGAITHLQGPTDQPFAIKAGTQTGSNVTGQDLVLGAGLGTGNASPTRVKLQASSYATASGSTARTLVTRQTTHSKTGSTTTATATNMFNVAMANNQTASFEIIIHVETTQATPHNCSTTENFIATVQDTGGTVTQQTTAGSIGTICDTGTLTIAASFSAAAPSVFSVTPSWTTIVPTAVIITIEIHNLSQQEITLL